MNLGQLLMYVGYDTTVVLVQHGTDEQICTFTQSKELEYKREYEKEETPTFKTTIDLKSSVQAKIDSLTTEAEHLFKKRDRLEQQAINLSKKARKLNKLIETIKEFE